MILRRRAALAVLLLAPLAARGQARGAPNVLDLRIDYRADSRIGDGAKPVAGRLWRTRRALRHESREGGKPQILVLRLDRRLGWLALPELGMTIETGLDELDLPVGILDGGAGLTQTRLGREPRNGLETSKVRVERRAAQGATFDGLVWASDQGVIARIEGEAEKDAKRGRATLDFTNFTLGPLAPSYFEPPAGLQLVRVKGADLVAMLESLAALQGLGKRQR